jgi:hypothetical protein
MNEIYSILMTDTEHQQECICIGINYRNSALFNPLSLSTGTPRRLSIRWLTG